MTSLINFVSAVEMVYWGFGFFEFFFFFFCVALGVLELTLQTRFT